MLQRFDSKKLKKRKTAGKNEKETNENVLEEAKDMKKSTEQLERKGGKEWQGEEKRWQSKKVGRN